MDNAHTAGRYDKSLQVFCSRVGLPTPLFSAFKAFTKSFPTFPLLSGCRGALRLRIVVIAWHVHNDGILGMCAPFFAVCWICGRLCFCHHIG